MPRYLTLILTLVLFSRASAQESLWLEAEHFVGIKGHCWPMGKPEMKKTNGHWGLSGPGWTLQLAPGYQMTADGSGVLRPELTPPPQR